MSPPLLSLSVAILAPVLLSLSNRRLHFAWLFCVLPLIYLDGISVAISAAILLSVGAMSLRAALQHKGAWLSLWTAAWCWPFLCLGSSWWLIFWPGSVFVASSWDPLLNSALYESWGSYGPVSMVLPWATAFLWLGGASWAYHKRSGIRPRG